MLNVNEVKTILAVKEQEFLKVSRSIAAMAQNLANDPEYFSTDENTQSGLFKRFAEANRLKAEIGIIKLHMGDLINEP